MKIRTKLLGGFLVVVVLLLVSSLITYAGLTRMAGEVRAVNEEATKAMKALEIQSAIADAFAPVRRYLFNGNPSEKEAFAKQVAIVEGHITAMQAMDLQGKETVLEPLAATWTELREALTAVLDIRYPVGNKEADAGLHQAEGIAGRLRGQSYAFVNVSQQRLQQARQAADAAVRRTMVMLGIVATLALIVSLAVGLAVSGSITSAVTALTQAAECISMGELDTAITLNSRDELGDLAQSFERMRLSLKAAMERLKRQ